MQRASDMSDAREAWRVFRRALATCLDSMEAGDFLIVSHRGSNRYVQFASDGDGDLFAEAASNVYIEPSPFVLTAADFAALESLGWSRPSIRPPETYPDDRPSGSPNFHTQVFGATRFTPIARLAVRTLRDVYHIAHPRELEYQGFTDDGATLRFPLSGIRAQVSEGVAPELD